MTDAAAQNHVDVEMADWSKLPSQPLVSVMMLAYNHEHYIREALDSVLMQRVDFAYEICLGEDGSSDRTREICIEYAKKHPDKFRLFLRDRENPQRKRFKAPFMHNSSETFNACRGKYVAILEGDDYWTSAVKLQQQVAAIEADPQIGLCGHYACCTQERRPWLSKVIPVVPVRDFTLRDILRRDVGSIHTSTLLLRKASAIDWNKFASSSFGDYPLIISSLLLGRGHVLPQVMSTYRVHDGGVFGPQIPVNRMQQHVALWHLISSSLPADFKASADFGVVRSMTLLIAELRKAGRGSEALRSFKTASSAIRQMNGAAWLERAQLQLLALESLLLPRIRGLRQRLINLYRVRSAHSG